MIVQSSFRAMLKTEPDSAATFVVIPPEVEQAFGARGRIPMRDTINGITSRGSLSPYDGRPYLGVSRASAPAPACRPATRSRSSSRPLTFGGDSDA